MTFIYSVDPFNHSTWFSRNLYQIQKNDPDKSWKGQRGSPNGINYLDLDFQGHFEVEVISRIRFSIGQGRFKIIWRSYRRKWVKFYSFKMWIFFRVLLRWNKHPKVGQVAKHERPWLLEGQDLRIFPSIHILNQ